MANNITRIHAAARFKWRSDTAANWQAKNPILLSGEPGVVTDGTETEKIKIGDGVTPWNDLGWWKGPKGEKGDPGSGEGSNLDNYYTKDETDSMIGDISTALDELHAYAQSLVTGGSAE